MNKLFSLFVLLGSCSYAYAQTAAPAVPPIATDVTAEEITKFIDALPRDRVSDRPGARVDEAGRCGLPSAEETNAFPS